MGRGQSHLTDGSDKCARQRCTGHCCKRFTLPYTIDELEAMARRNELFTRDEIRDGTRIDDGEPDEVRKVADMVIYLGSFPYDPARLEANPDGMALTHAYTCKHYDTSSGNCTNYEKRPDMCRKFPYDNNCPYVSCESSARWLHLPPSNGMAAVGCVVHPVTNPGEERKAFLKSIPRGNKLLTRNGCGKKKERKNTVDDDGADESPVMELRHEDELHADQ